MNTIIFLLLCCVVLLGLFEAGSAGYGRRWGRLDHGRRHDQGRNGPMSDGKRRKPNRREPNGREPNRREPNSREPNRRDPKRRENGWFSRPFRRPGRLNLGMSHDKTPVFNFDLDFNWGHEAQHEPWWNGPNVCFTQKEEKFNDTGEITHHFNFQSIICDGTDTAFKCVKTRRTPRGKVIITDVHECCLGYTRSSGDFGCEQDLPLMDIPTLLETLNLNELIQFLNIAGVDPKLFNQDDAEFTVFAPSNEAFKKFHGVVKQMSPNGTLMDDTGSIVLVSEQISNEVLDNSKNILLGHVVSGVVTAAQLNDNMLIETASPYKSYIRINTYTRPVELLTANCRKVSNTDNMAVNGVVHIVDEILKPVTENLLDLISKNPELGMLKTIIGASDLSAMFKQDGHLTVIAPTDTAFKKHPKLLKDKKCLINILKSHVFPDVVCSGVIQGETKTRNFLNKYTDIRRSEEGKVYIEGAQVIVADVMATNGVLHIIDDVIIPDEGRPILEIAVKNGLTSFNDLVDKAGLKKELTLAENVTVFAPTNEAIQALPEDVLEYLAANPEELKRVLLYHVVPSEETCQSFFNNKQFDTLAPGNPKIRINEYSTFPHDRRWIRTAQCAEVDPNHLTSCNGIVQIIDKVMMPPKGNVIDILAKEKRFSTLVSLLKQSKLADTLQEDGPFSIFAPTNEAFVALGSDAIEELKESPTTMKNILLNHVTRDFVCCAGIQRSSFFRSQKVRTLSGEVYNIRKNRRGDVMVGEADILNCDLTGTNGVVHVIDNILMQQRRPWEIDLGWDW